MDAFVVAQTLINDFETRLRASILTANEPFLFYTGIGKQYFTGAMAWSLKGFLKAAQEVDADALEFHIGNGDFEAWAKNSLKDDDLTSTLAEIKASGKKGQALRKAIVTAAKKRYTTLSKQVQKAVKLF
jgi:hypothetical protein